MGWLKNKTIRSYTKKAFWYLNTELDKVIKESPGISNHDALKKIGKPISWNWRGETTTNLDQFSGDDADLFYAVVFFLVRQWLLAELNIMISKSKDAMLIFETAQSEIKNWEKQERLKMHEDKTTIISCQNCGQKNRLTKQVSSGIYKCNRCGSTLKNPSF